MGAVAAFDLTGKRALITGGARGQGACEARLFAESGAQVLIADVLAGAGRELAESIGSAARFVELDVTKPEQWGDAITVAETELGGLDVLVNNAGIVRAAPFLEMALADYRAVVEVNQIGCFLGMQSAAPLMIRAGGGSIVNVSSIAGMKGAAGVMGYAASKWAIRGMTKTAALELGVHNIRVNSVHPGTIDTPMVNVAEFDGVDRDAYFRDMPVPRMGRSEEIAVLVAFLASDASTYCTGSEFLADGGELAGDPVPR
jgi:3alpha(or 20beta)-hydroxysteroid dehydrogenase